MNEALDPDGVQWLLSVGIFLVGGALSGLTYLAWRREHDRKLLVVTAAYVLFAVRGLSVVVGALFEPSVELGELHPTLLVVAVELFTHLSAVLVLVGLVLFFVAVTRS